MRVTVLDYSGHPCQVQLSRSLAARSHVVQHLHCPQYASGKGALERQPGDPATFSVHPIGDGADVERYRLRARLEHERAFAKAAWSAIERSEPDVVVLCNVPLLAHGLVSRRLTAAKIPTVFWQQDVYSEAIRSVARRRLGPVGSLAGAAAARVEGSVARSSAAVVSISDAFVPHLRAWGVPADAIRVVPNWAPLAEMPTRPRDSDWARVHDLAGRKVALYAGTLGLKHDPSLLLDLARTLARQSPEDRVVVVSEGAGRTWLETEAEGLPQLVLLDYQPYADLPDVLGAADVLLSLLEPDAGAYSVPSKVLNYLCAGRALVAALPAANGAAQMIEQAGAGVVIEPGERVRLGEVVLGLFGDDARRQDLGAHGRAFAESHFDLVAITDTFEEVLSRVTGMDGGSARMVHSHLTGPERAEHRTIRLPDTPDITRAESEAVL